MQPIIAWGQDNLKSASTPALFRSTAVMYMRRAGMQWETIAKITGHKGTKNLIAYYDTYLEGQGMQVVRK